MMSGLLIKIEFRWNRGQSLLFLLPNIKKNDEHGAQNIRQGNKTISQKNMQVELFGSECLNFSFQNDITSCLMN